MKKETKKAPTIRFRGFTDDWEQRKLGDYVTIISGDAPSKFDEGNELYVKVDDLNCNSKYVIDSKNKVALHESINKAPEGSVVFPKRGAAIMTNKVRILADDCYIDTNLMALSSNKIDSEFLYNIISKEGLYKIADTSTIPQINNKHIEPYEVLLPRLDEQRTIGKFFKDVDNFITLHQRKLDQLKTLKKYFLQNMFPAKGEKVPRIRFKGFTGDWEQKKLKDVYNHIGNAFVGTATPYYVKDGHFYLESNNVKDGQINRNTEVFINDKFYKSQKDKWLHTGDIVMVQSGHVGHSAVIPSQLNNTAAHALIIFKKPKIKIDPYFLNYQYQTTKSKKQFDNITVGNTIKHILASSMYNFIIDMPSYEEQQEIAHYLKEIDNLITLHQRKLDQLQIMKKFMLQNLFI